MSGIFGKTYKINRVVTGTPDTYYEIGGAIIDANFDPRMTLSTETGSGEGRQLTSHKAVAAKPVIDWTMNIRRLEDYITTEAMITAEGAVPSHTLYITDGTKHRKATGKVNTCRITIRQLESIKAAIQLALSDYVNQTTIGTFKARTEKAMFKDALTTLTVATLAITRWSEVEFGVNNNVLQEILGTTIKPTETEEQEALYSGHILRARKTDVEPLDLDALAGTSKTVVIALQDNQTTPVTSTFTFTDALLKTSRIIDKGLGLVMERIEWQGDKLAIT